jgi:hypothetical protein
VLKLTFNDTPEDAPPEAVSPPDDGTGESTVAAGTAALLCADAPAVEKTDKNTTARTVKNRDMTVTCYPAPCGKDYR